MLIEVRVAYAPPTLSKAEEQKTRE